MGNNSSYNKNNNSESSLIKEIDFIIANYIATQNFQDMKNLSDIDYCNKLVIMTTDIIASKLSHIEVTYLAQKIQNGNENNELEKEKIIYIQKNELNNLDSKNETTKKRLCNGIAKFYVKVAHLFGAIMTTVNPVYIYKDMYGKIIEVSILNKNLLPKDANIAIKRKSLCAERLSALINDKDFNIANDVKITIEPNFCDINYNKLYNKEKKLIDEPGIVELDKLYYDIYNYETGGFTEMSNKMRKDVYEKDVIDFYIAFTGNKTIPTDSNGESKIKTFKDVPLRDFHKSEGCKKDGAYTKSYSASLKNKLFKDYADHIKTIMKTTSETHDILLEKLQILFSRVLNKTSGKKEIIINPELTEISLQKLVDETRNIIVRLYITCEKDFNKGLEIFEAIVEKQIMNTSKQRIENLQSTIQSSIVDDETLQEQQNDKTLEPEDTRTTQTVPDATTHESALDIDVAKPPAVGGRIQPSYNKQIIEDLITDF